MNSPSREEIDAKLQTVEARLDGRVAAIQATVEAIIRRLDELSARVDNMSKRIDNLRVTIIVTGISSSIAIIAGVGAITSAMSANMLAAFKQGGDLSAERAEIRRQAEQTDALLQRQTERTEALLRRLDARVPAASPKPQQRDRQPNQ
jgi:septal ring factor EnvC (AmiA/AmiB activator)